MTRLISPIARVKIGDDEFITGDRLLRHVSVTLGEDARASKCRFEVYDPGLLLADKYFKISFEQGGIQVPDDLLGDPAKQQAGGSISLPEASSPGASSVADASQTPEIKAWLDTIAWAEGTSGPNGYNIQFTGTTFQGYADHPRQIRSSGGISSDAAGRYQFLSTTWDSLGLGAFTPENQDKGAVMLMQRRGALASAQQGEAGIDATLDKISYEWASLPPYRYGGQGTKTNAQVKDYYRQRLAHYKAGGSPTQQAAAQQPAIKDKADTKPVEIASKGTEIIIELGYDLKSLIAFHFIHIGTHTQGRQLDSTVFEGQSIRWLMTRRTKNTSHSNITLRQLAERVAVSYGLTLEMEGDGPTYQHIEQVGITDYELLLREARAIGYSVQDQGTKLILKPWRPQFTGFVITPDMLISLSFSDRASKDRSPSPGSTTSTPDAPAGDSKFKIDRISGVIEQVRLEDTTATGKALANQAAINPGKAAFTGQALNLDLSGATGLNEQTQQAATGQQRAVSTQQQIASSNQGASKQAATTGSPIKPVSGTPKPESAKPSVGGEISPESVTGLPKQEVGAIDLADGRAEAQAIQDEQRRVKGYESRAELIATPESLTLAPGSIIGISRDCVPETFAREWRVGSVTHTMQGGRFTTSLDFYSPQAAKAGSGSSGGGSITLPEASELNSTQSASGWASPMPVAGNSSCGAKCEFGYARGRLHAGIDYGGYGSGSDPDGVFAASNGIVIYADRMGGYGRTVDIKRSDGWMSRYAHLAKIDVQVGQEVKQGQRIGTRGGSGASSDNDYAVHLHFEIRDPGGQPRNPREFLPKPQIPIAG